MDLWGDTMQYQFSSWSGMSALTQHANDVPDKWGFESQASCIVDIVQLNDDNNNDEPFIQGIKQHLEMLRKHNIQSWLEHNPSWNAPQDKPAQMLFIPSGAALVLDLQASLAAIHSMSPDSRVV
eukprot:13751096-Ditylum_brightwellii.AAC.1